MDKKRNSKKKKFEIRFMISKEIYEGLKDDAKELDITLAGYIKANIEKWRKKCQR